MDNHTTVECGQLIGNEGATPEATPKFVEDIFYCTCPGTPRTNAPHKGIIKAQGCNDTRKTQNTGTTAIAIAGLLAQTTFMRIALHRPTKRTGTRNHQHGEKSSSGSHGRAHKLCDSMRDESLVVATHQGLVKIPGSKLEATYIPTFRVSLLSIAN